ncbi:MAG: hypothetical protein AB1792_00005 [Candidatus Zixiibacteriota bacterium]
MRRLGALLLAGGMGLCVCPLGGPNLLAATIHVPAAVPTAQGVE